MVSLGLKKHQKYPIVEKTQKIGIFVLFYSYYRFSASK